MKKFIGTWKNKVSNEIIELTGVYLGDYYILRYEFSEGVYQKEEKIIINIGIPTGENEPEVFHTRLSTRFGDQLFTVNQDCLTIDNQKFIKVK